MLRPAPFPRQRQKEHQEREAAKPREEVVVEEEKEIVHEDNEWGEHQTRVNLPSLFGA